MSGLSRRALLTGLLSSAAIITAGPIAKIVTPQIAAGNQALWLADHAQFLEGMSQRIVTTVFYGNPNVMPLSFAGFAPCWDSSSNVMDCGEPPGASWKTLFGDVA